jgi:NAD(P)-dependent dehydrogenase (short-subunit alcohol dehydrogenase family)
MQATEGRYTHHRAGRVMITDMAVIVGATGALGRAIAASLAGAGLRVLAVSRTAQTLDDLKSWNPAITTCVADIACDDAIASIAAAVSGPVRMVVHGPGLAGAGDVLTIPTQALADSVNIKAGGMLRLVRAVDAHLKPHSRLVAIGGHYGLEPSADTTAAGVANAALLNLTRQLSQAYGPRGITAHYIAPGPAETERLRRVAGARAARDGVDIEDVIDGMRRESAIGGLTTPAQLAWAVALLLAPEADAMTGSTLMLECGRRRGLP